MENAAATKTISLNEVTKVIIMRHLKSFLDNDLEAVIADYTNDSVFITHDATYKGLEEIKTFFAGLMIHFPKQTSGFELDKLVVNNELAFIVWHANTSSLQVPMGTDTFIIKNDKIFRQTFAGQLEFL